jgi:hypothetical protein
MGTDTTFSDAVAAIVAHHAKLYNLLLAVFPAYRGEGEMPPRESRASRILDCEKNDAHRILEELATAAKAKPRGSLGAAPDTLIAECRDFLAFLESNLPSPDCAAAISDICQIEEAFVNFIKGISGGDPSMSRRAYSLRIDKFVRDMKAAFRSLGHSIVKFECELTQFRFLQKAKPSALPEKRKRKKPIHIDEDSVKTTRRNDCDAAIKEIRRRVKNGESYAQAASYLKRNSAWNVRLAHLKTATLIRYAKDKKR